MRINPNTVARSYATLDTDGVITTQRGRGTYVREHPDEAHLTRIRQEQLKAMMDNLLHKSLSLGYTPDEIKDSFEVELAQWVRQRQSAASSQPAPSAGPESKLVLLRGANG